MTTETLRKALLKAAVLPAEDQELLGRKLDAYIDDIKALRAMLDEAAKSLDAGDGGEIDIEKVIARARAHAV